MYFFIFPFLHRSVYRHFLKKHELTAYVIPHFNAFSPVDEMTLRRLTVSVALEMVKRRVRARALSCRVDSAPFQKLVAARNFQSECVWTDLKHIQLSKREVICRKDDVFLILILHFQNKNLGILRSLFFLWLVLENCCQSFPVQQ